MAHDHPQPHIQHVALVAGRRFPRDRAGDPMTELLGCPFCGGNDLIRGVRYAKYSDTKDDAIRCQACDCNVPLKAWNARHAVQATPDRVSAAAEYLVQTVDRKLWGGIRADGRAKDGGFEPFHYSQHSVSVNGNARQEDYRDVVREIARILSLPSTQERTP